MVLKCQAVGNKSSCKSRQEKFVGSVLLILLLLATVFTWLKINIFVNMRFTKYNHSLKTDSIL